MKTYLTRAALLALLACGWSTQAQPILSLDVNDRTGSGLTMSGFDPFVIASQSAPTVQSYGDLTVTVSLGGGAASYDDRERPNPVNSGAFTQSLLLRDFMFVGSQTTGSGLDILVDGLTNGVTYQFTIWSYDVSSTGNRVSDWSANGFPVKEDYVFNGSVTPTSDAQYQFSFKVPVSAAGQVLIEGRRDAATSSAGSVFVNALQVEVATPEPPPSAFSIDPATPVVAENSPVTFTPVGLTATTPLAYQWQRSDGAGGFTNIAGATEATYTTPSLLLGDNAAQYRCVASNLFGSSTSDAATVTVFQDTEAPSVVGVQSEYPYFHLLVTFSEPVDPLTALDDFNYLLEIQGQVNWTNITMPEASSVLLQMDQALVPGDTYTLLLANLQDRAPAPNVMADTSFVFTAATRLGVDIEERGAPAGTTQFGFNPFVIGSVDGTGIQTNATTQTFGSLSVTLSGAGENPGYDDRLRNTPTDGGDFTQSLLLRDFVFSRSTTSDGGLDILVSGLTGGETYQFTIWSFDTGSPNNRVSDWSVNGSPAKIGYVFNGAQLPADNEQYQFSFKITAPSSGEVLVQSRNRGGTFEAFLDALRVESAEPDPPTVTANPGNQETWAGGNVIFTAAVAGTAPYQFQWQRNGGDVPDATNLTLVLFDVQTADAGDYALVVNNAAGTATSAAATLTVNPVANLTTALISHWPLDELTGGRTPDVTPNQNDLTATNMGSTNLVAGQFGNALSFNGTDQLLFRGLTNSPGLPVYAHPSYTVSLWVKGDFTNQIDRRVFSEGSTTNGSPLLNLGTHNQGTNAAVDIYIRNNDGVAPVNHEHSSLAAFDDQWHHLVWVDNNGYGRVYVDGAADTNEIHYLRGDLTPDLLSVGGIVRATPSHWFAGTIDDVAVWGRALSPAEIQQVMAHGPVLFVEISRIEISGDNLVFTLSSAVPGAGHRIEETSDLAQPVWTEVSGVVYSLPVGDEFTATFPAPTGGQHFYRVTFTP